MRASQVFWPSVHLNHGIVIVLGHTVATIRRVWSGTMFEDIAKYVNIETMLLLPAHVPDLRLMAVAIE